MTDYTEFISKTQTDILNAVKQAQENNVKAIASFGDAVAEYATRAKSFTSDKKMPSPIDVMESAFDFTAQLIELQKNYYVKMAATFASAQKKATDTFAPTTTTTTSKK